jgi:hypothetical protein
MMHGQFPAAHPERAAIRLLCIGSEGRPACPQRAPCQSPAWAILAISLDPLIDVSQSSQSPGQDRLLGQAGGSKGEVCGAMLGEAFDLVGH